MTGTKPPEGWSLRRWSRLKREAAREKDIPTAEPAEVGAPPIAPLPPVAAATAAAAPAAPARGDALPPVQSLTIDSDFSAFLQPEVDETLKRQALKQLFRDPRFNVMDGLDVYIDDYSRPDPIDPDIVRQMVQGRYIFDPPPTRINAQGHVEDVPAEELAAALADTNRAAAEMPVGPSDEADAPRALPLANASAGVPLATPDGSGAEVPSSDPSAGPETSTR